MSDSNAARSVAQTFSLAAVDKQRVEDFAAVASSAGWTRTPNRSKVVGRALHHLWTENQDRAIGRLQIAAAAAFGVEAAFVITGPDERDISLGAVEYDGRWPAKDEDGRIKLRADRWEFKEMNVWDAPDRWGPTSWDFRVVRHTERDGEAFLTTVGIQVTSEQGTSPLGHKPFIWVATGTHAGDRYHQPIPIWEWSQRSWLASDDGRDLAALLPDEMREL